MTLDEAQASLAYWKAAYNASSKGELLQWEGRVVRPQNPDACWKQITRMELVVAQLSSRNAVPYSIADLSQ